MIERLMEVVTRMVGNPWIIPIGLSVIAALYATAGVDVANITISIVTFLLLPILQHSQNRDGLAIQTKLDALIEGVEAADNRYQRLDEKPEEEIRKVRDG